jgi:hypothetical protein
MAGLACGSNLLVGVPQWGPPAALASSQGQLVMSHNAICLRNKAAGSALMLSRCVCKFFLCEVGSDWVGGTSQNNIFNFTVS